MRRKKKALAKIIGVLGILLCLTGCGDTKKEAQKEDRNRPVAILDANNYNPQADMYTPILKSDTGYYYMGEFPIIPAYNMHYFDNASKQNIYLCSRPECLHLGDEFCTATMSADVYWKGVNLYDDKLYVAYLEWQEEDGVLVDSLRLASAELDGSAFTNLATMREVRGDSLSISATHSLFIHRGMAFCAYGVETDGQMYYETAVYNLVDHTLSTLPSVAFELNAGNGNVTNYGRQRDRFQAEGQYVYYNEYQPKGNRSKTVLCRYNIETGEIETAELTANYSGTYRLKDENTLVYVDNFCNLYAYKWNEKEVEKLGKVKRQYETVSEVDGEIHTVNIPSDFQPRDFLFYEDQMYCMVYVNTFEASILYDSGDDNWLDEKSNFAIWRWNPDETVGSEEVDTNVVDIYRAELKKYKEQLDESQREDIYFPYYIKCAFLEDTAYLETPLGVYSCALKEGLEKNRLDFALIFEKDLPQIGSYVE